MTNVASEINSFLPASQDACSNVSQSEDSVFILSSEQLQEIIKGAIEQAIQPLQEKIEALEDEVEALRASQKAYYERFSGDILDHGQRLKKLEKVDPQPLQKDRGEILRALIAANGGKMLAKDARQKMHLSKELFSMLLATMSDYIEIKPLHSDNRRKLLIIRTS